jgi:hypothetical protein
LDLQIPEHLRAKDEPGAYVIQARGLVNAAFRARLRAAGVEMVSYIPNNAWLVRASAAQAQSLAAQPEVQAALPFEPYYKIKSSLLPLAVEQKKLPAGTYLNVVLFDGAREQTAEALARLGINVMSEAPSPFGTVLTVHPTPESLAAIAGLPGVQIIERAASRVPANDLSRVKLNVATDTLTPVNYFGLTGTNVLVALADSGVDTNHVDLVGRVILDTPGAGFDAAGLLINDERRKV